ncbi:MAG TPA: VOC family protein [Dehalococcoidia bacterium]|nr:VOC family protein [Dehalococcoidia bacterium]
MPTYTYDHIHLRTRDPQGMAAYFSKVFDAKIIESVQSDGVPRVDLDLDGLIIFIAPVAADANIEASPKDPYLGLDHFGLRVESVDDTVAELKRRGAEIVTEPRTIRPGVRIAFVRAPDDVRIELLERS